MLLLFTVFFGTVSAVCIVYTLIILTYSGPGTAFLWFWPLMGISCFLAGAFFLVLHLKNIHLHKLLYYGVSLAIFFAAGVFLLTEGTIMLAGREKAPGDADYVIVLGAQVKGKMVSRALKSRLDTAYEYLKDNPETTVIVSGGQGRGEDITEASAMKTYLVNRGIEKERILTEEKSVNTHQNLVFSRELIGDRENFQGKKAADSSIIIATNRFHVFRALRLAENQGLKNVYGLGAPNGDALTLHYYVREFFGVVKDTLTGNMKWRLSS